MTRCVPPAEEMWPDQIAARRTATGVRAIPASCPSSPLEPVHSHSPSISASRPAGSSVPPNESASSLRSFLRRRVLNKQKRSAPCLTHEATQVEGPSSPTIRARHVDFDVVTSPNRSSTFAASPQPQSLKRASSTPDFSRGSPPSQRISPASPRLGSLSRLIQTKESSRSGPQQVALRHVASLPQLRRPASPNDSTDELSIHAPVLTVHEPLSPGFRSGGSDRSRTSTQNSFSSFRASLNAYRFPSSEWLDPGPGPGSDVASTPSRALSPAAYLFVDGCLPPGMTLAPSSRRPSVLSSASGSDNVASTSQDSPPQVGPGWFVPLGAEPQDHEGPESDGGLIERAAQPATRNRTRSTTLPGLQFTSDFDGVFLVRPTMTIPSPTGEAPSPPHRRLSPPVLSVSGPASEPIHCAECEKRLPSRPKTHQVGTQTDDLEAIRPPLPSTTPRPRLASDASGDSFVSAPLDSTVPSPGPARAS